MFRLLLLCLDLAIPVTLLLSGRRLLRQPPQSVNVQRGYRTMRSMRNAQTWAFAQTCSARLLWRLGWAGLVLSLLALLPRIGGDAAALRARGAGICLLQCVLLPVLAIAPVELALKRRFPEEDSSGAVEFPLRQLEN